MLKKWLVGLLACASASGVKAIAADKIDFDQGGDVKTAVNAVKADAPQTVSDPQKTYTVSPNSPTRATGLAKKDLPESDWQAFQGSRIKIPDTFDLRDQLTPIEDQGQCGSCWAFSLTATHRDGHALGGNDPGRLSQEWLVDDSPESQGCNGGYFDSANDLISPKGQPSWDACPYSTGAGKCAANLAPAASIKGWHMLGKKGANPSVRDIEAYMTSSGKPVSITVDAVDSDWMAYNGGVYNGCALGQVDHMINIVGWDNEGAKFDWFGNLPHGKGVWILRNSWGASWGEKGFMRTKMTDSLGNRCNNVAEEAAYFDF